MRDAAPERARLHRRAQPREEWTPELDAALTRLLPRHPEKGLLETLKIHARQGDEQVSGWWPSPICIKLRAGNWFVWLAAILTMDPPITLDVADLIEAFPELRRQSRPVEHALPPTARPTPPRPIKPPLPPPVKRSLPSPMKRLPQPPRESAPRRSTGGHRRSPLRLAEQPASKRAKKLTSTQRDRLTAFAKESWGGRETIPGPPRHGALLSKPSLASLSPERTIAP